MTIQESNALIADSCGIEISDGPIKGVLYSGCDEYDPSTNMNQLTNAYQILKLSMTTYFYLVEVEGNVGCEVVGKNRMRQAEEKDLQTALYQALVNYLTP